MIVVLVGRVVGCPGRQGDLCPGRQGGRCRGGLRCFGFGHCGGCGLGGDGGLVIVVAVLVVKMVVVLPVMVAHSGGGGPRNENAVGV